MLIPTQGVGINRFGYVARLPHAAGGAGVVPALSVTYCTNPRPGWAIENTICADCADFELQCFGPPSARTCQWVQVTDLQTECWNTEEAEQ